MKFEDFIELHRGYDLPKKKRKNGQVPVIASTGINGTHNVAKIKGPGVVTGRSGSIGKVQYIKDDFWPLNTTLYVSDFKGNNPKFVAYWLERFDLKRFSSGSAVPTLNRNELANVEICVPNREEQDKIVAILEPFERKIELNQEINDNLVELINTIYHSEQSVSAKDDNVCIGDLFDTTSITYKVKEHPNELVWHFSIPNFDQKKYPTIDSVNDIKSNKIIVKPYSVLVSKLNPATKRIWAPNLESFNKYPKLCSTEFVPISGNNKFEQAIIFAITNSSDFIKYLSSKKTGSTNSRQRVRPIDIFSYVLPIKKENLYKIQMQLTTILQKIQVNQDEIATLTKLKQELLIKYF